MNEQNIKYIKFEDASKKDPEDEKKTLYDNDPEIVIMRTRDKHILIRTLIVLMTICCVVLMINVISKHVALYDK